MRSACNKISVGLPGFAPTPDLSSGLDFSLFEARGDSNADEQGRLAENGQKKGEGTQKRARITEVISTSDFKKSVLDEKRRTVVVMFYASYCKSCQRTKPRFQKLANMNPQAKFIKVPFLPDKNIDLFESLNIAKSPYGLIYQAGEVVGSGSLSGKNIVVFKEALDSLAQEADDDKGVG